MHSEIADHLSARTHAHGITTRDVQSGEPHTGGSRAWQATVVLAADPTLAVVLGCGFLILFAVAVPAWMLLTPWPAFD